MDITAFLRGLLRRLLRLHEVETGLLMVLTPRAKGDVGSQRAQVGIAAIVMVERDPRWNSRTGLSLALTEPVIGVGLPLRTVCTSWLRECGRALGPLWDGLTSRSSTAHVGHHVQPLRRLAHLRTVRLGAAFATSSRRHLPSWWYMTPHIIRDRAGAIRPDFSVCVEGRASCQSGRCQL